MNMADFRSARARSAVSFAVALVVAVLLGACATQTEGEVVDEDATPADSLTESLSDPEPDSPVTLRRMRDMSDLWPPLDATDVPVDANVHLAFQFAVSDDATSFVEVDPAIPFESYLRRHGEGHSVITLELAALQPDTNYTVTVSAGFPTPRGTLEEPWSYTFETGSDREYGEPELAGRSTIRAPMDPPDDIAYRIEWDAPDGVTRYEIEEARDAVFSDVSRRFETETNAVLITVMEPVNRYYRVRGWSGEGATSAWSRIVYVRPEPGEDFEPMWRPPATGLDMGSETETARLFWDSDLPFGKAPTTPGSVERPLTLVERVGFQDSEIGALVSHNKAGPDFYVTFRLDGFDGPGHIRGAQFVWRSPEEDRIVTLDVSGDDVRVINGELRGAAVHDNGAAVEYHLNLDYNPVGHELTYVEYEHDGVIYWAGTYW